MISNTRPLTHRRSAVTVSAVSPTIIFWSMLGVLAVFIAADLMIHRDVSLISREGHSLEVATVLFFLLAFVLWEALLKHSDVFRRNWHIPALLILMGMRELDFDKRFTTEGILQLRLYSGPAPLVEKLIGASIVVLILICAARLLFVNARNWITGLHRGRESSWLVFLIFGCICIAKSFDGLQRKLASIGFSLSSSSAEIFAHFEEGLEAAAAITAILAVIYYANERGIALPAQKKAV